MKGKCIFEICLLIKLISFFVKTTLKYVEWSEDLQIAKIVPRHHKSCFKVNLEIVFVLVRGVMNLWYHI